MRAAFLLLLAGLAACNPVPDVSTIGSASLPPSLPAPAWDYPAEQQASLAHIAATRAAISRGPVVWPQWETLANALLANAQLTGNHETYQQAAAALDQAFALAGGGGPYLSRARLHFATHRLALVEADLDLAARSSEPDHAAIIGLRADLDFQRGHYTAALAGFRSAVSRREDLSGLARLALCHARLGHFSEAAALLDRAGKIYHGDSPHPLAWLALQRGLLALDRGRWAEALAHYQHALRLLPGWWLVREHIAEIHALQGDVVQALSDYTDIVAETGNPEYMDAMAQLLHEQDKPAAQGWVQKADAVYQQRLLAFPEASYGHALDHYLLFGSAQQALELAQKNHALRPNGAAQLQLAKALLRAKQLPESLQVIRTALASGWNTAELHQTAALVFSAAGLQAPAASEAALAKAINPRAATQYAFAPAD